MTRSKTRAGSLTRAKKSMITHCLKMNLCRLESEEKTLRSTACQRHIFQWSTLAPTTPTQTHVERTLTEWPTTPTVTFSFNSSQQLSLSPAPTKTAQGSTSTRPLRNQATKPAQSTPATATCTTPSSKKHQQSSTSSSTSAPPSQSNSTT